MAEELKLRFSIDPSGVSGIRQIEAAMRAVDARVQGQPWGRWGDAITGSIARARAAISSLQAPIVAVIGGIMSVRGAIGAMADVASRRGIAAAFRGLVADADEALARMRSATRGMASDSSLRAMATSYVMAGGAIQDLIRLLPAAQKIAMATGQDVASVGRQIADAMRLGRERTLEQYLGVIDAKAAWEAYARATGQAVSELSEVQKKAAVADEAMRRLARLARMPGDVTQEELARATARIDRWIASLKGAAVEGLVRFADDVRHIVMPVSSYIEDMEELRGRLEELRRQGEIEREIARERRDAAAWAEVTRNVTTPLVRIMEHIRDDAAGWALALEEGVRQERILREVEDARAMRLRGHLESVERYGSAIAEIAELEARSSRGLTLAEEARLGVLRDQVATMERRAELTAQEISWLRTLQAAREAGERAGRGIAGWLMEAKSSAAAMIAPAEDRLSEMLAQAAEVRRKAEPSGRGAPEQLQGLRDLMDIEEIRSQTQHALAALAEGRARVEMEVAAALADADRAFDEQSERIATTLERLRLAGKVVAPGAADELLEALEMQRQAARQTALARLVEYDAEQARAQKAEADRIARLQDEYLVLTGRMHEYQAAWREIARMPVETEADREAQAIARRTQAWREQTAAIEAAREAAQRAAEADAAAIRGVGEGIYGAIAWARDADADLIPERMARATEAMQSLGGALGKIAEAQSGAEISAGMQGMISGLGSFATALGAEVGPVAALMAALSAANAAFAAAGYNYAQAIQYGAAALAYTVVAGMALSGSGRGSSGVRAIARSVGSAAPSGGGATGTATYNIYLTGREIIHTTDEELGAGIISAINKAKYSGVKLSPQVMP